MRLGDLDALTERVKQEPTDGMFTEEIVGIISALPTIDPVHAASGCYCRECFYFKSFGECANSGNKVKENDFCSYGEQREAQDDG